MGYDNSTCPVHDGYSSAGQLTPEQIQQGFWAVLNLRSPLKKSSHKRHF
ncbi:hypothetical protein IQ265_27020 [Nodosilinea sp. LEGE 06152]|nr:hypothetical protein [Nodosilinea sp. LEGE 06152]MBE9160446.1 hypothetical protein [Nodosilinea sp. LEGE 06152]